MMKTHILLGTVTNSAFTLKEEILIIGFYSLKKHDYHDFFLERESTAKYFIKTYRYWLIFHKYFQLIKP